MERRPGQIQKSINKPILSTKTHQQSSADKPSMTSRPNTTVTPKK